MPSLISGFEYDIFISYRHNDNRSGWVSGFIENLKEELSATIKDPLSVYFDSNPTQGLLENHNVGKSLEGKLKCLIFIPIISQTYCDPKSFAWQHEFIAFNAMAKEDRFGRDVKVSNGNVASRILPIRIHDLDSEDKTLLENELGGILRSVDFIYKSAGVNRPLKPNDERIENLNHTHYRDQINKVANAVKEILSGLKYFDKPLQSSTKEIEVTTADRSTRGLISKLQEKRIPKVLAIYGIGCLGILWAINFCLHRFEGPMVILHATVVVLIAGLLFIFVRLWFHVEKKWQRTRRTEFALLAAIALGAFLWVTVMVRSERVGYPTDERLSTGRSIIVLPFKSFKLAETADDYLEDGVTSAIVTELTKIKELSVISEAISFSFKSKDNDLKTIAQEVGVNYVLQGRVQRVNERVKISAQLIDVSSGFQLWADQFERKLIDIFAIENDISSSIAKALKLELSLKEKGQLASRITESIDAYEYYLKGKFYLNSEKEADIDTSIVYLEKAVKADPKFTLAYAELAWAYGLKNFWWTPNREFEEKAFVAAEKVFELDSGLADGIYLRAFCSWTLKNRFPHVKAIREYKKALALNPRIDRAHNQLGIVYFHIDQFPEAMEEARMATSIDPYAGFNQLTLATIYYYSNDYKKLVEILNEWPENFTAFEFRVSLHAVALINLGREREAEDILSRSLKTKPNSAALNGAYAVLLAKRGDKPKALKAIEKVEHAKVRANHFHHATYNIGVAYSLLNEREKSLYWLRWTAENGFPCYSFFKNDPLMKNMQGYPPFIAFLSELKKNNDQYRRQINENAE